MKQTAVEWLIDDIDKMQKIYIDLNKKDKSLKEGVDAILTSTTLIKMKCIHAKQMEKEQIIEAHGAKQYHKSISGEQYYNETFKNKTK